MSLQQTPIFILGTQTLRRTLESTYTAGNTAETFVRNASQLLLEVEYAMGETETNNSIQIRIRFTNLAINDIRQARVASDWYQEITEAASAGTITVTLAERNFVAVSAAETRWPGPPGGFET